MAGGTFYHVVPRPRVLMVPLLGLLFEDLCGGIDFVMADWGRLRGTKCSK